MYEYTSLDLQENTTLNKFFEAIDNCGLIISDAEKQEAGLFSLYFVNSESNILCKTIDEFNSFTVTVYKGTVLEAAFEVLITNSEQDIESSLKTYLDIEIYETGVSESYTYTNSLVNINDEEYEKSESSWRNGTVNEVCESIVPPNITSCRVVALVYNDETIAYRFKTNVGSFDMNRAVARKFGLMPDKVKTCIRLQLINGIYMSKGEINSEILVPDISYNKDDCIRLYKLLLKENN